jgi:hypothetical protein
MTNPRFARLIALTFGFVLLVALGIVHIFWSVRAVEYDGLIFLCKRVVVTFSATSSEDLISAATRSVQGAVVRQIPEVHAYELSIPGRCNPERVVRATKILQQQQGVQVAEPELVGTLH